MAKVTTIGGRVVGGNCGTGAGGFKAGNKCQKGGSGSDEGHSASEKIPEFGNANEQTREVVRKSIAEIAADFPEVNEWVKGVDFRKEGAATLMEFDEFTGTIQMPKFYAMKSPAELNKDFFGGTHAVANDVSSTVTHEVGHAIDRTITVGLQHDEEKQSQYIADVDALREKLGNPSKLASNNRREFAAEQFVKERREGGKGPLQDIFRKYIPDVDPPKRKKISL